MTTAHDQVIRSCLDAVGALDFSGYRSQATRTPGADVAEHTPHASTRGTGATFRNTFSTIQPETEIEEVP